MGDIVRAVLVGDADLVVAARLAGLECDVIARPTDSVRFSRRVRWLGWADPWSDPEGFGRLLMDRGREGDRPVLLYQSDASTLFISRHREELRASYRFIIPDAQLVEDVVDKLRFLRLAKRLGLPVPASTILRTDNPAPPGDPTVGYPALAKPGTRDNRRWTDVIPRSKGIALRSRDDLEAWWPTLHAFGGELLVQQMVEGPESAIVSYHCYAQDGVPVAEFTGRKVRTRPLEYGHTTALVVDDDAQVIVAGRAVIGSLGLTGVAKLDFKRDEWGELHLLEVNPRFSLWHHPGAVAGVNLPAFVAADLLHLPRPASTRPRHEVAWLSPGDLEAALASGLGVGQWLRWAVRVPCRSGVSLADPAPLVALVWGRVREARGVGRRRGAGGATLTATGS